MQKEFEVDHERGRNHGSVTNNGTLKRKGKKSINRFSAHREPATVKSQLRAKYYRKGQRSAKEYKSG